MILFRVLISVWINMINDLRYLTMGWAV